MLETPRVGPVKFIFSRFAISIKYGVQTLPLSVVYFSLCWYYFKLLINLINLFSVSDHEIRYFLACYNILPTLGVGSARLAYYTSIQDNVV